MKSYSFPFLSLLIVSALVGCGKTPKPPQPSVKEVDTLFSAICAPSPDARLRINGTAHGDYTITWRPSATAQATQVNVGKPVLLSALADIRAASIEANSRCAEQYASDLQTVISYANNVIAEPFILQFRWFQNAERLPVENGSTPNMQRLCVAKSQEFTYIQATAQLLPSKTAQSGWQPQIDTSENTPDSVCANFEATSGQARESSAILAVLGYRFSHEDGNLIKQGVFNP